MAGEIVEVTEAAVETAGEVVTTICEAVAENPMAVVALASIAMAAACCYWMHKVATNSGQQKGA